MSRNKLLLLIALAELSITPCARASDSVSVYQIAVTGDSIPGTGGTYTSFSAPTTNRDVDFSTGDSPFWFTATSSNGNSGVYVHDAIYGTITALADTTMAAPTGGNFASFSNLASGEGVLGFFATDTHGTQGLYTITADLPLTLVATSITFGHFQNLSTTGAPFGYPEGDIESTTGFYGFYVNGDGSYTINPIAGASNFSSSGPVSFKGTIGNSLIPGISEEIFAVSAVANGVQGVYYAGLGSASDNFVSLVNAGAATPDGTGHFTSFGNPLATPNEIAFTAHYSIASGDQQGVFTYGPYQGIDDIFPTLQERVATGQIAPNSGGATFTGFSDLSDTSFDESFIASLSSGGEGLYIDVNEGAQYSPGPQLLKVVATGDVLDGQIVQSIELAPDASNYYSGVYGSRDTNSGIGFEVNFTDGSEGVYYFDVNLPEPASLGLLALPALLMLRRR